jgi:hypothetical protein
MESASFINATWGTPLDFTEEQLRVKLTFPIFIVGYPRSGTTLLQALIATQKNVVTFPETHFFDYCANGFNHTERLSENNIEMIVDRVQKKMGFQFKQKILNDFLQSANTKQIIKKDVFEFVVRQAIKVFSDRDINSSTELRYIEKTPSHAKRLNEILTIFPQGKIIVMVREPIKSIISRKLKIPGDKHRTIKSLARSWSRLYKHIHSVSGNINHRIKIIRLEDLLDDRQGTLVNLCDFLGLDCEEEKFENFGREAKNLIVGGETWKRGVEKGHFVKSDNYKVSIFDKFIIKHMTGKISCLYGY